MLTTTIRENYTRPAELFRICRDRIIAKEAVLPALVMSFLSLAHACINSFIVIYGEARGVDQIDLFFTVYAAFLLISRPLSGTVSDRFGQDKVIIPACCLRKEHPMNKVPCIFPSVPSVCRSL